MNPVALPITTNPGTVPLKQEHDQTKRRDERPVHSSRAYNTNEISRERNPKDREYRREETRTENSRDHKRSRDEPEYDARYRTEGRSRDTDRDRDRGRDCNDRDKRDDRSGGGKRRREGGADWYVSSSQESIPAALRDKELDDKKLAARQKQIDFGKNTIGYQRFVDAVPKSKRTRADPLTPNKFYKCSKRSFDGQIRRWRRLLHVYDPPGADGEVVIDLENEEDDILSLEQELEEERENKENDKSEVNVKTVIKTETKAEIRTEVKTEIKIELKTEMKAENCAKLPFSEPLERLNWADVY